VLHIPNFLPKSLFPYAVSPSHEIYYFGKRVTNLWDGDTSFGNQLLEQKFGKYSISLFVLFVLGVPDYYTACISVGSPSSLCVCKHVHLHDLLKIDP
jgi:hypothetical protein